MLAGKQLNWVVPAPALSFSFSWNIYKVVFVAVVEITGESSKGKRKHPVGRWVRLRLRNVHLGNKVKAGPAYSSHSASLCSEQGSFQSWPCRSWVLLFWGKQDPSHTYSTHMCQRIQLRIFSTTILGDFSKLNLVSTWVLSTLSEFTMFFFYPGSLLKTATTSFLSYTCQCSVESSWT